MSNVPQPGGVTPPFNYYGGKQRMLRHLFPLIPVHKIYVEAFLGGGALFWTKEPSEFEVINDVNGRILDFYRGVKYDFASLERLIDETFHARIQFDETKVIYEGEEMPTLAMAWAVWTQANQGFSGQLGGTFGYDRTGKTPKTIFNKKSRFTDVYKERMKHVTVECRDALKVMQVFDGPDTFFYLDPPYVSSDQGHYEGYTDADFRALLDVCVTMKGKFLLSSYPESILMEYRDKYGWNTRDIQQTLAVTGKRSGGPKQKTECLTWNYAL